MDFLEKDLEEIIYTASQEQLWEKGINLNEKLIRQKRIGNYGVCDLIGFTKPFYSTYINAHVKGEINVIELKNKKIGVSTFFQALNYLQGIKSYLDTKSPESKYFYNYKITLIGREIDLNSSFCYLPDIFNVHSENIDVRFDSITNVELYLYDYDLNGITFKKINGYNLINKGF